jgi:cell surface protein SprA
LKSFIKYVSGVSLAIFVLTGVWAVPNISFSEIYYELNLAPPDTDTTVVLPYPFPDRGNEPLPAYNYNSPLYLGDPSNITTTYEYDPFNRIYHVDEKIGSLYFRDPTYLSFDEFVQEQFRNSTRNYWVQRSGEEQLLQRKSLIPTLHVGGEAFDRIFGGNTVDIRPQGSAELIFGANIAKNENPALPEKQRSLTTFDFKQRIQMNVIGKIGDKLRITTNYNTEATFDFENQMKLEYTGYEDEIIQKIEAGNVTLPLAGTLITGSQSLFGIKTALKFGRLTVTSVFSQQKGKTSSIQVTGGAQTNTFDIPADQYEANRHYFIAEYFKNNYDNALSNLPIINSPVNITRIEVWITNKTGVTENTRNIIGLMDLAEPNP